MINIEMCVRSEENNLGLYVRGSNEMLLKGIKTENLKEKEDFKKNSPMSLKINGIKRECMDSLFVKFLKKIDKDLSREKLVQSDLKVQTEATISAAKNKH